MTRSSQKKLPKSVQSELDRIASDRIVIATVWTITLDDVAQFRRNGLGFEKGKITTGEPAPPPRECGIYSRRNLDGWEEKRKDLPKELREISNWAPNWRGNGHHLTTRTIDAWPVEHHSARLLTISADVLEHLKDSAIVRFRVDQPLNRNDPDFALNLRFNLQLLRETVGDAQIYPADMSYQDFARIQHVRWELLPLGSSERVLERLAKTSGVDQDRLEVATTRLRVLDRLDHDGYILGTGKFARYFGVKFGDRLIALENLEYGNALYVFEDDWDELSQLSRTELIKRRNSKVHRVPHIPGWQSILRQLLRRKP